MVRREQFGARGIHILSFGEPVGATEIQCPQPQNYRSMRFIAIFVGFYISMFLFGCYRPCQIAPCQIRAWEDSFL